MEWIIVSKYTQKGVLLLLHNAPSPFFLGICQCVQMYTHFVFILICIFFIFLYFVVLETEQSSSFRLLSNNTQYYTYKLEMFIFQNVRDDKKFLFATIHEKRQEQKIVFLFLRNRLFIRRWDYIRRIMKNLISCVDLYRENETAWVIWNLDYVLKFWKKFMNQIILSLDDELITLISPLFQKFKKLFYTEGSCTIYYPG